MCHSAWVEVRRQLAGGDFFLPSGGGAGKGLPGLSLGLSPDGKHLYLLRYPAGPLPLSCCVSLGSGKASSPTHWTVHSLHSLLLADVIECMQTLEHGAVQLELN